jgi:16S rRNA (uracil1498-N3)-methyltransferase
MHRFHLPPAQCHGSSLLLTGREAHHGLHVVRIRRGETVLVLDGGGTELRCEAAELTRTTIRLEVRQRNVIPPLPFHLTLVQAIPKGKLFDSIIQKATELEACRIIPLLSERVVTQLDESQAENKLEHWRTIAIEAIKQCGNAWLPRIDEAVSPEDLLKRGEQFELPLIGSLEPGSRHPRDWFQAFAEKHGRKPESVCVWVGPEGDFTAAELAAARSAGLLPITLGRLVLRSDTAAVYCLSVLNHELQAK